MELTSCVVHKSNNLLAQISALNLVSHSQMGVTCSGRVSRSNSMSLENQLKASDLLKGQAGTVALHLKEGVVLWLWGQGTPYKGDFLWTVLAVTRTQSLPPGTLKGPVGPKRHGGGLLLGPTLSLWFV